MYVRVRTRESPYLVGTATKNGVPQGTHFQHTHSERMEDVVGNLHKDNPMERIVYRSYIKPLKTAGNVVVSGHFTPLYLRQKLNAHTPGAVAALITQSTHNKALALSNPSRPKVDLPVFVAELADLPRLVQLAGKSLLTKNGLSNVARMIRSRRLGELVADGNLNYQFGWAPLVDDLSKLAQFSQHVANKQRVIDKLKSGEGIKRKVTLSDSTTVGGTATILVESATHYVQGVYSDQHKDQIYAVVRWHAQPGSLSKLANPHLAWTSTLGLDITASTLWEMTPWSWMVDWFSDLGDILMSQRNTIPAKFTSGVIVIRRRMERNWTSLQPHLWESGSRQENESIVRKLITPTIIPTFEFPFLDARRLSILGSLSVLKASAWGKRSGAST